MCGSSRPLELVTLLQVCVHTGVLLWVEMDAEQVLTGTKADSDPVHNSKYGEN